MALGPFFISRAKSLGKFRHFLVKLAAFPFPLCPGTLPNLYKYNGQSLAVQFFTSYALQQTHSKQFRRIAFNGLKETTLVPPSFDLIVCLIISLLPQIMPA